MFKFTLLAALLLTASLPVLAMSHFLTDQWLNGAGSRMCAYSNGTVLNVGYRLCPLQIKD